MNDRTRKGNFYRKSRWKIVVITVEHNKPAPHSGRSVPTETNCGSDYNVLGYYYNL